MIYQFSSFLAFTVNKVNEKQRKKNMNSVPPPYSDHPNYSQSPPPQGSVNYAPQQMPMPMPQYNQQTMYPPPQPIPPPSHVTVVTQQPCKSSLKKKY